MMSPLENHSNVSRIYKIILTKRMLIEAYRELNRRQPHTYPLLHTNPRMETLLTKKSVRSDSGIGNVSVSLPPSNYSCKYNCHFCPNEAGMPRSYISNEDVFKRALRVEFDTVQQVHYRFDTLEKNGYPVDKIDNRVLGGTFSCYDHSVTHDFMRDLFYATNTWGDDCSRQQSLRDNKSLYEEQCLNETAKLGTSQHRGFGKRLLATAETIAKKERCVSLYVISGVCVIIIVV